MCVVEREAKVLGEGSCVTPLPMRVRWKWVEAL
jgi:hypothetical protein